MSYCRWSSDDWQCDVYVFEHGDGGWTTHIAGNRVIFSEPLPEPITGENWDSFKWLDRHERVMKMLDTAQRVDIDHPEAGQSYSDPTPQACANRLEELKAAGFQVPQYAIDMLRDEEIDA